MDTTMFLGDVVHSDRTLYTPAEFARQSLIFLQESGKLQAVRQHTNTRQKLESYLFVIVTQGSGKLYYGEKEYRLEPGSCVFIDCRVRYSHIPDENNLWCLKWVHFNGKNMEGIYKKYLSRGGQPAFITSGQAGYESILGRILDTSRTVSDVRDMTLCAVLMELLTMIMTETSGRDEYFRRNRRKRTGQNEDYKLSGIKGNGVELRGSGKKEETLKKLYDVRLYLDEHYAEHITADALSKNFFISRSHLSRLYSDQFGISINSYLNQLRITNAKYRLRFTGDSIESVGAACGLPDPSYFNRVFKKIEGIAPSEYRKKWAK